MAGNEPTLITEKLVKDINECENSNPCPLGNSCQNTDGSFECHCDQPGWFFVEDICVQGSICDSFPNICGEDMFCKNVMIDGEIRDYKCTERHFEIQMETTTSSQIGTVFNYMLLLISYLTIKSL